MPGPPGRRRPKAAGTADPDGATVQAGPPWPGADPAIGRYEALRAIALAGAGGGWRYQLPVLASRGMASWLAQGPAVTDPGDHHGSSDAAGRPVPVRPQPCPARYQHERR